MNWKIVVCNLTLIIGIIVLTCWNIDKNWPVIIGLASILIISQAVNYYCMNLAGNAKRMKEEVKLLKDQLYEVENNYEYVVNDLVEKKKKIENLDKETKNDLLLFYNTILIRWAKDNKAYTDFETLEKEFDEFRKLLK